MFLRKDILRICSKFTGEHPCRSVISIKLQSNFIKIILWHECSPVNLLHIFRTPFPNNTSGWLLLLITFAGQPSGNVNKPFCSCTGKLQSWNSLTMKSPPKVCNIKIWLKEVIPYYLQNIFCSRIKSRLQFWF